MEGSPVSDRLKRFAKVHLDSHDGRVRGSRFVHPLERLRAYRSVEVRPELCDRLDLLEPLIRDGIVVEEGYVPQEQVAAMRAAAEELIERVHAGGFAANTFTVQPEILVRIGPADELLPESAGFFNDVQIRGVIDAAMSPSAVSYRRELEHRFGIGKSAQADLYHFDNWRPILKAFLYLDDVGPDQAPFAYLPGTHTPASWKRRHEREFDLYGPTGPFGHFFPQEMRALRAEHGWEEVVCTGKAGTLILADLRGLHRGTRLESGHRILLNNTFDLMNA